MELYAGAGRRRILPPLVFGLGVLFHLLRHGRRYEVVHTASFPYFSLLAAAALRPLGRFRLVVDWHEVWSSAYWAEYLGAVAGRIGNAVQALCVRIPQHAFCFSRLHAERSSRAASPASRPSSKVSTADRSTSANLTPPNPWWCSRTTHPGEARDERSARHRPFEANIGRAAPDRSRGRPRTSTPAGTRARAGTRRCGVGAGLRLGSGGRADPSSCGLHGPPLPPGGLRDGRH